MLFELYDNTKDLEKYNYWNISKQEYELIKKHIYNLEYFNFPTKNILDYILDGKKLDNNKKLLLNTEYEQDLKNVLELFKKYSTIKYNDFIDLYSFFYDYFNIKLDGVFYIIDENKVNLQELKINQDLFEIKSQMFIETEEDTFEIIKQKILQECKNKKFNKIMILRGDFLFNENIIKNFIVTNKKINIPNDFTEFYLDYVFEQYNYRYNKYINYISSYNKKGSSIINLKNDNYNYYGVFPILNKNIIEKKEMLIKKFNYMRNKYKIQTLLINLDRRKDRFENFIKNYGDEYPNIMRFSAIDGKNFDFKPYLNLFDITEYNKHKNIKNPYNHHNYLKGVLGCGMSHYTIWKLIYENKSLKDNDYILVLEDDIILTEDFNLKFNKLLEYANFDYNWDVIYLGFTDYHKFKELNENNRRVNPKDSNPIDLDKNLIKYFKNFKDERINDMLIKFSKELRLNGGGTFAYLIRKKGALKYLEYIRKYKIQQAIDWFMIELFDKMNVYKCEPELVFSKDAYFNNKIDSDVQNLSEKVLLK